MAGVSLSPPEREIGCFSCGRVSVLRRMGGRMHSSWRLADAWPNACIDVLCADKLATSLCPASPAGTLCRFPYFRYFLFVFPCCVPAPPQTPNLFCLLFCFVLPVYSKGSLQFSSDRHLYWQYRPVLPEWTSAFRWVCWTWRYGPMAFSLTGIHRVPLCNSWVWRFAARELVCEWPCAVNRKAKRIIRAQSWTARRIIMSQC